MLGKKIGAIVRSLEFWVSFSTTLLCNFDQYFLHLQHQYPHLRRKSSPGTQSTSCPHSKKHHWFIFPVFINHKPRCNCPLRFWISMKEPAWPHWVGEILAKSKESGILSHSICFISGKKCVSHWFSFGKQNKTKCWKTHSYLQGGLGAQNPSLQSVKHEINNLGGAPTSVVI